nr:nuclear transport factor 2 family protein [Streptomyces sp. SID5785]
MRAVAVALGVAAVLVTATLYASDYAWAAAKEALRSTPAEHDREALAALDPAVRGYVDAVAARDLDALVTVFDPHATVDDTGRLFRGRAAIEDWARDEVVGGSVVVLHTTPAGAGPTVLLRFDPAGLMAPFRARYAFDVEHDVITRITLRYA